MMKPDSHFVFRDRSNSRGGHDKPAPPERESQETLQKEQSIQERTSPPGDIVYEAIYREGEHELDRNSRALAWSGLAAGLSMGFSFVSEGLLRSHLPEDPWQPVVIKLGYAIGFLIVILGRQQLFTKNTLWRRLCAWPFLAS